MFGYGSLMWRPDFAFIERRVAVLHGRRRAFCIHSVHHRGTPERPGLVLGLLPGGRTLGVAFRVAEADWPRTHAYLREREQPTETYQEAMRPVRLRAHPGAPERTVEAVVFLSDRTHPQWAGALGLDEQATRIAGARGLSGRNLDYLRDLVVHLRAEGAGDRGLERLLARVVALEASAGGAVGAAGA